MLPFVVMRHTILSQIHRVRHYALLSATGLRVVPSHLVRYLRGVNYVKFPNQVDNRTSISDCLIIHIHTKVSDLWQRYSRRLSPVLTFIPTGFITRRFTKALPHNPYTWEIGKVELLDD